MKLDPLKAISPIDGRYHEKVANLSAFFSEEALIKYRVKVEVAYFLFLCKILPQLKEISSDQHSKLAQIPDSMTESDAQHVKELEKETNHDVKAVEYLLKEKWDQLDLGAYKEFIHFGLTSQDVNNTAGPMALKDAINEAYLPLLQQVLEKLDKMSKSWADIPMLARTHGQPASPTLLGKELSVFSERINTQLQLLKQVPHSAKFGGATGNFNAHHVAYPDIDWKKEADKFVGSLGLSRLQYTTQIEHYDNMAAIFDTISRINTILIDLARDVWTYISQDYFKQKLVKGEVGSSTMPHKVNPIDFENAEGNLGLANSIFRHLSQKLPISRMQRDLTDSTVSRNTGVPFGHTLIALHSLIKGMDKLLLNEDALRSDLDKHWSVVTEAIQTILRREGYPEPYEKLKDLSRSNGNVTQESLAKFIDTLDVSDAVKAELKGITPFNYTGMH